MATTQVRMGVVQLRIMRALWQKGRATARELTEALSRKRPIAHSTVQTLLRQLEAKGAVAHDVQRRTFVFHPLVTEQQVRRSATRELLSRVYNGSAFGLVAHLLRNERISRNEMRRIRQLLKDSEGKK